MRFWVDEADPHVVLFHVRIAVFIMLWSEPDSIDNYLGASDTGTGLRLE